jgi:hypothetical protein
MGDSLTFKEAKLRFFPMRYTLSLSPALSHWMGMVDNSGFMLRLTI